jgi:hypothetical protein
MRALLTALVAWVRDDKEPPPGVVATIADRTLVPPTEVMFPAIPANAYGNVRRPAVRLLGVHNWGQVPGSFGAYRVSEDHSLCSPSNRPIYPLP